MRSDLDWKGKGGERDRGLRWEWKLSFDQWGSLSHISSTATDAQCYRATLSSLSIWLLPETLKLSFRKQLKQVEDQGLSNFAGTKTIQDRVCLLGVPNSGQNLTSTSSVTSSHRFGLCRNFEINVGG